MHFLIVTLDYTENACAQYLWWDYMKNGCFAGYVALQSIIGS